MSTSNRLLSAFFTCLPGLFFLILLLLSDWFRRDYWWGTYAAVLIVLIVASLLFGFALPMLFQKLGIRHPGIWIFLQGLLAWSLALVLLGLLNLTPLCIGQNNGDGNNDLSLCILMTALAGIIYTPIYLGMQVVSALLGHRILSWKLKTEAQS